MQSTVTNGNLADITAAPRQTAARYIGQVSYRYRLSVDWRRESPDQVATPDRQLARKFLEKEKML
jgi:hypothetical protein